MRGRTGDSRVPGSARSFLGVLAVRRRLSRLAFAAVLLLVALGGRPSQAADTRAGASDAASEPLASDRTTSPPTWTPPEPLRFGPPGGADDRRFSPEDTWRAAQIAKEERSREAAWQEVLSGLAPPVPTDGWQEPLLKLVSDRLLFDSFDRGQLVMATIELHHNDESFRLLLKYGLTDDGKGYIQSDGNHWGNPAVEALWFLRAYDPTAEARSEVEKQLQLSIQRNGWDDAGARRPGVHGRYIEALLASWDFARGLSDSRRKAYQDYERRRWMAWSLTAGSYKGTNGSFAAASRLCPWPKGDEDFVLRNYECPVSTKEEVLLSGLGTLRLPDGTHGLSEEVRFRLQAVARSDLPWAEEAARVLSLREKGQSDAEIPSSSAGSGEGQ